MLTRASLLLVLFLLVSAPLSAVAEEATTEPQGGDFEPSETTLSEQERLALAASHWQRMPEASMVATSWKPSTGLLHLAGGSFDPTMQDGPELPVDYQRTHDMAHTGMAVVQLDRPDGMLFDHLSKHDLTVLDILHDEGWLVRLPPSGPSVYQNSAKKRVFVGLVNINPAGGSLPRFNFSPLEPKPSPSFQHPTCPLEAMLIWPPTS